MNTTPCEVLKKEGFVRDKDLRKALLMGVDFSMTGRNKPVLSVVERPVHGRFRHGVPSRPECWRIPAVCRKRSRDDLIPAYDYAGSTQTVGRQPFAAKERCMPIAGMGMPAYTAFRRLRPSSAMPISSNPRLPGSGTSKDEAMMSSAQLPVRWVVESYQNGVGSPVKKPPSCG